MTSPVITVAELNRQVKLLLEKSQPLLWVAGEVSNLVRASSGHVYFSLKDSSAQVRCVMFRTRAQLLPWQLENGQQVEVQALVTLYEARGDFQLNIEGMRRAGIGRLYELFQRLRDRLAAEGLFAAERKRGLPRFPRCVGIVTSPQAAALRDVIAAFARRAPHVELRIFPALVQGAEAPAAIVAALRAAAADPACDLLLLVRGGGSLEDLWAFNDEAVARTLAVSPAPTISGIGHETDTTIVDYVADQRAATPTAAAELASAGWFAARTETACLARALQSALLDTLETRMQAIDRLALRLVHPAQRLAALRQRLTLLAHRIRASWQQRLTERGRLERLAERLPAAMRQQMQRRQEYCGRLHNALTTLSPLATLARGYSIVRSAEGHIVTDATRLQTGSILHISFASGSARTIVDRIDKT